MMSTTRRPFHHHVVQPADLGPTQWHRPFWKHQPSILGLALALGYSGATGYWGSEVAAQTLPQGAQVIAGQALLSQNGKNLTVTTSNVAGGSHSAINWQSFNIGSGYSTYFAQPSANSTSINRVVGNNPSQIYGNLGSNGKLVLVNPAGIAVGPGAVVDTAGFTATTLSMAQTDAQAGILRFNLEGAAADLNVQGRVISRGGDVALIAPSVQIDKEAVIEAPDGTVALAAGRSALVVGRGMEGVVLQVKAPTDTVLNLGKLKGDAVALFASTLKHSGDIQANAVTVEGGKVKLVSSDLTDVSGSIRASRSDGQLGGEIAVTSTNRVMLRSGAVVDASGEKQGGTVAIGGGWQGQNLDVVNALWTEVQQGAQVKANATIQGAGGRISVWSSGQTQTHGDLQAHGAGAGGDGGQIETSGHQLVRSGLPDVSAGPGGKAGNWLLDPDDVVIQLGASPTQSTYTGAPAPTIYESEIEQLSKTADISIQAQRSIVAVPEASTVTNPTSDKALVLNGHALSLLTSNLNTGTICATGSPCGIDLSAFTSGVQTRGGDFKAVTGYDSSTGTTALNNAGVYAAPIVLPAVITSGLSTSASGRNGQVLVSSSGTANLGDITTRSQSDGDVLTPNSTANAQTATLNARGGNVQIAAADAVTVQSIDTSGLQRVQILDYQCNGPCVKYSAGSVSISGNSINVMGDIQAHAGYLDIFGDYRMGQGGNVSLLAYGNGLSGQTSIRFTRSTSKAFANQIIDVSSGGPEGLGNGDGFAGGQVSIEALKGNINTGINAVPTLLEINANGGRAHYDQLQGGSGGPGQGGGGGWVTIKANDAALNTTSGPLPGIVGQYGLVVSANGGKAGISQVAGQPTQVGLGGKGGSIVLQTAGSMQFGSVDLSSDGNTGTRGGAGGLVQLNNQGLAVTTAWMSADGGDAQLHPDPTQAYLGEGGQAGAVRLNLGQGSLNTAPWSATGTTGSLTLTARGGLGAAYSTANSTPIGGMGGDGGTVEILGGINSQMTGNFTLNLNSSGAGINSTLTTATPAAFQSAAYSYVSQENGGFVHLDMGSLRFSSDSALFAEGGSTTAYTSGAETGGRILLRASNGGISNFGTTTGGISASSGQCGGESLCVVELQANGGAINISDATTLQARRLNLQAVGTAANVSIGKTDASHVTGSMDGSLSLTDWVGGGSNIIDTMNNTRLVLGLAASATMASPMGLRVGGKAAVNVYGFGMSGAGPLQLAAGANASATTWSINAGGLTMGDASARLSASDSVNLSSGFSGFVLRADLSNTPLRSTGVFDLFQDTVAGINAPVLRLDNTSAGPLGSIKLLSATPGTLDFTAASNSAPGMKLVLNTNGEVLQSAGSSLAVNQLAVRSADLLLIDSNNRIGQLSATVSGGIKASTGTTGTTGTGTISTAIPTNTASVDNTAAGLITVNNATSIVLGGVDDPVTGISAGLFAKGDTTTSKAGVAVTSTTGSISLANGITAPTIQLSALGNILNTSGTSALLDTSNNANAGNTITLAADGNIGVSGNFLAIQPGLGNSATVSTASAQPVTTTRQTALYIPADSAGLAHASQLVLTDPLRDVYLDTNAGWDINSALSTARSLHVSAEQGSVQFTASGSLGSASTQWVELNAAGGSIFGPMASGSASTAQITAEVALLFTRDSSSQIAGGVDMAVNTGALVLNRNSKGTGSADLVVHQIGSTPLSLVGAYNDQGKVQVLADGALQLNGQFPSGAGSTGYPLGVSAQDVSLRSQGMEVYRSVVASAGNVLLDAGSGVLNIQPQASAGGLYPAPQVHVGGQNVALLGSSVNLNATPGSITSDPLKGYVSVNAASTPPSYPLVSGFDSTDTAGVKILATGSFSATAQNGLVVLGGPTQLPNSNTLKTPADSPPVAVAGVSIVAPTINLSAKTLTLGGGAQTNAYASIHYTKALNLAISDGDAGYTLQPGSGVNADAAIWGDVSPNVTPACSTCTPDWAYGTSPLSSTLAQRGIGPAPAPAPTPSPSPSPAPTPSPAPAPAVVEQQLAAYTVSTLTVSQQLALDAYISKTSTSSDTPLPNTPSTTVKKKADDAVQGEVCR